MKTATAFCTICCKSKKCDITLDVCKACWPQLLKDLQRELADLKTLFSEVEKHEWSSK